MTRSWTAASFLLVLVLVLLVPLAACDTGGPGDGDDDVTATGLDRCAVDGAQLAPLWDVSNLHGEIVSMAVAAAGTVVLGTADGAVKQWALGASAAAAPLPGGRPSYGEPFDADGPPARALAIGADGATILAADDGAGIQEWSLATAERLRGTLLKGSPFTAVIARSAREVIVADLEQGGQMRAVDLDSGLPGAVFATSLWGVSSFVGDGDSFYVVGHDYLQAAVERRTFADPTAVADLWDPQSLDGAIRAAAVSPDGAWLVTGGQGHVLVFDTTDLAAGPVATRPLDEPKFIPTARSVAFTASGAHVAIALEGRVALLGRDLVAETSSIDVPTPVAVAVDPSGERLVVASADGRLRAFACQ
jgi:WD40 repeat protein